MKGLKIVLPVLALGCLLTGFGLSCPAETFASSGSIEAHLQGEGDRYYGDELLSAYRVPSSFFTAETDGGGTLSSAFDGDFSTAWEATEDNSETFHTRVTVTFQEEVALGGILYRSSDSAGRMGYGYPVELTVTSKRGEETDTDDCASTATGGRVYFAFPAVRRVSELTLEFTKVNPQHRYVATAREIVFLQPGNAMLDELLLGKAYTDYTRTSLGAAYAAEGALERIARETGGYVGYEEYIAPLLLRAERVRAGAVLYDGRREFSTSPSAENVIERHGGVQTYAHDYLKMASFGADYQPTGIAAAAGSVVKVYVEAPENDPLPSVVFTQTYGDWRSWKREFPLKRGENVFTVPNFIAENPAAYTVHPEEGELVAGGAVYLVNPYLDSGEKCFLPKDRVQSDKVKVYLEGGVFYPLYRTGEDPHSFALRAERYSEQMAEDPAAYPDVAELFTRHALVSSTASAAKRLFVDEGSDISESARLWDELILHMLRFGGVATEEGTYYNLRNDYLRHNPRIVQPWGGAAAYAANGLLGFCTSPYNSGWDGLLRYGIFGWALPHEFGHSFDIADRTIGEVTNNMWAFDYQMTVEKNVYDRNNAMARARELLTPDGDGDGDLRTYENQGGSMMPRFEQTRQYTLWFLIESCFPGYWGKLENTYRFYDYAADCAAAELSEEELAGITQEERHVYLNSVTLGIDMGYYFDRWDFYFSSKEVAGSDPKVSLPARVFDEETASAGYKKLVKWAMGSEKYKKETVKFWYLDYLNYVFRLENEEPLYTGEETVTVSRVTREGDRTTLLFTGGKTGDPRHLGYEILRDGKVIGFTVSEAYTDDAAGSHTYTVRAYDRFLHATAESAPASPSDGAAQTGVCKIGETIYDSLEAAVAYANGTENCEIVLLKDCTAGCVTVTSSVTVRAETAVTLTRGGAGDLFLVKGAKGVLTLSGFTLDGGGFLQEGSLVRVTEGGKLIASGVIFRNNVTAGDGGAICTVNSHLELRGVTVTKNRAKRGGGIAHLSGSVARVIENVTVTENEAEKGGGVYMDGAMTFSGGTIARNRATLGGGIAAEPANSARALTVQAQGDPLTFTENTAEEGSAVYLNAPNARATLGAVAVSSSGAGREIAVPAGQLTFSGTGCTFSTLYLGERGQVFLTGGVPENKITVTLEKEEDGAVVLSPSGGFVIPAEGVGKFALASRSALALTETGELAVRKERVKLTLVADGGERVYEIPAGEPFRLPLEWDETRYVLQWSGAANKKGGEEIVIRSDSRLTAQLAEMCLVTLSFPDGASFSERIVPAEKFYLPERAENGQLHILAWRSGSSVYAPLQGVTVEKNTSFTAVCEALFRVTVDGETAGWREYLGSFRTPEAPEAPEGMKFDGWLFGDRLVGAGEEIAVTADTVLTASFSPVAAEEKPFPIGLFVGCMVGIGGVVFLTIVVVIMKKEHDLKYKK